MGRLLEGKRAVVTGSSRGVGFGIAQSLLSEGAHVVIVARHQSGIDQACGTLRKEFPAAQISGFAFDLCDANQIKLFRNSALKAMGGVDIVVANIGSGVGSQDAIPNSSDWDSMWGINFDVTLATVRVFQSDLEKVGGNLVFISSIAGLEVLGAPTDYSTAKAALGAFAKNLSHKLAPKVRVNVVSPGNILCDTGSWAEKVKQDPQKVQAMLDAKVPLKRFGTAREIGDAVAFLASEKASFITGSTLVVDGGQTVSIG